MVSRPQVHYSEGILDGLHNLESLCFGCLSEENRDGWFLIFSLLFKGRKSCFSRSLITLFHCLSCGGELGSWRLDICTVKLVGFLLFVKIAWVGKKAIRFSDNYLHPTVFIDALRTALPQEPNWTAGKNEKKILLLLIPFLKIMPKIVFRGKSLTEFKHLLAQWNNSEVCVQWCHLVTPVIMIFRFICFSKHDIKALPWFQQLISAPKNTAIYKKQYVAEPSNIIKERDVFDDHTDFILPSKNSLQ